MRARALPALLSCALALPLLVACSGAEAEEGGDPAPSAAEAAVAEAEAGWREELDELLGEDAYDFAALQQQAAADCQRTAKQDWVVELALSGSLSRTTSAVTRTGLAYACPDAVAPFRAAVRTVESAADPLALVCSLPAATLDTETALKLDLVCAAR